MVYHQSKVKRLIKGTNDVWYYEDPYLGKYVQIVNRKSKYYGYYAWVADKMASDDRYKLYIEPKPHDDVQDQYHINFIKRWDAPKWLNVIEIEHEGDERE